MNHAEAIRLNNTGASMMLAGRDQESAHYFAKSLGMMKQLLAQSATRNEFRTGNGNSAGNSDVLSSPSPQFTHETGSTPSRSSTFIMQQNKRRRLSKDDESRSPSTTTGSDGETLQFHKTVSVANLWKTRSEQEELFFSFRNLFFLQTCKSASTVQVIKCHCACVIFNMALLHHKTGHGNQSTKSLAKAERLYRLSIQILKDFVMSLTNNNIQQQKRGLDGTSMLVMLASLNNLSHILYVQADDTHQHQEQRMTEAVGNMRFLSRLLNASKPAMVRSAVVSEKIWSSFVLNALIVDQRLFQAASAA